MKLAIILVLCTIAYIISTSLKKIRANRQEADARARQQEAKCDVFLKGLTRLNEARNVFVSRTSHLGEAEQESLWMPVIETKVRACKFLMAHDFNRATAFLATATEKADGLLAQYQPARSMYQFPEGRIN
jgi:hypothetical protein